MADTTTTNYSLTKPEVGASDDTWGTKLNANLDTLDSKIDDIEGKSGAATLKHADSTKLATSSTGIDVTGVVEATGYLSVEGTSGNTGAGTDRWIGGDGTAGTWFYNVPTGSNHYFAVNNTNKLSINSSGVDISGTVTADGLGVDGTADFESGASLGSGLNVNRAGHPSYGIVTGGNTEVYHAVKPNGGSWQTYMKVTDGGDINFYEDTGTTPKFFWDASAESLGIGTSSPNYSLTSYKAGANANYVQVVNGSSGPNAANGILFGLDGTGNGVINKQGTGDLITSVAGTERMRINSSGHVGIGCSPSVDLDVRNEGASGIAEIGVRGGSGGAGVIHISGDGTAYSSTSFDLIQNSAAAYVYQRANKPLVFGTNNQDALVINSSGNVGIGTSSPSAGAVGGKVLHVQNSGSTASVRVDRSDASTAGTLSLTSGNTTNGVFSTGVKDLGFSTNSTERMRIDSSGNVLVGNTVVNPASGFASQRGFGYEASTGQVEIAATSNIAPLELGRNNSNDGSLVVFRKQSVIVGSIGVQTGALIVDGKSGYTGCYYGTAAWLPRKSGALIDNSVDLGASNWRMDDIYATNGTIQTSDRNEKQDIAELTDAEQRVAVAAKGLLRKFRWKDSVAEKGDDARIHFGIIAQDLQAAFEAESLDAGKYAMFISTTWWEADRIIPAVEAVEEVLDEDGSVLTEAVEAVEEHTVTDTFNTLEEAPEGATERTRMGVRYSELLAFIIGAI